MTPQPLAALASPSPEPLIDAEWLHENDIGCLWRNPTGTMDVKACDAIYHEADAATIRARLSEDS